MGSRAALFRINHNRILLLTLGSYLQLLPEIQKKSKKSKKSERTEKSDKSGKSETRGKGGEIEKGIEKAKEKEKENENEFENANENENETDVTKGLHKEAGRERETEGESGRETERETEREAEKRRAVLANLFLSGWSVTQLLNEIASKAIKQGILHLFFLFFSFLYTFSSSFFLFLEVIIHIKFTSNCY